MIQVNENIIYQNIDLIKYKESQIKELNSKIEKIGKKST
jgi:hypothetical protein